MSNPLSNQDTLNLNPTEVEDLTEHPRMLTCDCVTVEDFMPVCTECDEAAASKVVMLDAVNNGMTTAFGGQMCEECANEVADRLRESLPPSSEDANV